MLMLFHSAVDNCILRTEVSAAPKAVASRCQLLSELAFRRVSSTTTNNQPCVVVSNILRREGVTEVRWGRIVGFCCVACKFCRIASDTNSCFRIGCFKVWVMEFKIFERSAHFGASMFSADATVCYGT